MSATTCPKCRKQIAAGSRFCSYCGFALPATPAFQLLEMSCSRCGAPVQYGENVETVRCNFCGNEMYVNDKISEYNRKLRAETAAADRYMDTQIRYENAQTENRKKLSLLELLQNKQSSKLILILGLMAFIILIYSMLMLYSCRAGS